MTNFLSQFSKDNCNNQIITAIPTIFNEKNEVDFNGMTKIIDFQIENGVKSIVVGGSTGELLLLEENEYLKLIEFIQNKYFDMLNIIGCCTSASTQSSLNLSKKLKDLGIKSILCATPFYIKPNQDGIFDHFNQISKILPTIIYSVPSRTANDMDLSTIKKLSHLEGIVGYKDASSDISRTLILSKYVLKHNLDFKLFAGDDINYLSSSANGASGIISVVSNIAPKHMIHISNLLDQNDYSNARIKFFELLPWIFNISLESNPIVIKYMISKLIPNINDICRKPLTTISASVAQKCDHLFLKNTLYQTKL